MSALEEYLALPVEQRSQPRIDPSLPCPEQAGQRVEVVQMGPDPDPLIPGLQGTVEGGNAGQVWVRWDNGRTLNLLVGVDRWKRA